MKNLFSIFFIISLILISTTSCKEDIPGSSGTKINVSQSLRTDLKLSDLIILTGFTILSPSGDCTIRSIHKVIYVSDKIVVLDNETDFKNVWMFDNNGTFIEKVFTEGDASNQYKGLNDISAYKDEITLLSAAKREFLSYSINSKIPKTLSTGAIGDMLERTRNGNYILYNEHSGTEVTQNNYLVFYDDSGNLIKTEIPYSIEKENVSYEYTGFLSRSGQQIWFSPPFSNIVYEVGSNGSTPRYEFDFGPANLPADLQNRKLRLPDVENFGFLNEWFVKNNNMIQFEYQLNNRVCHGIYDESTGQFCDIRNIVIDPYSKLFSRGTVMPKSEDEFILTLRAGQVESLVEDKLADKNSLNQLFPGLGDALETAYNRHQPIILSFKYKEGAKIAVL